MESFGINFEAFMMTNDNSFLLNGSAKHRIKTHRSPD